MESNTKWRKQYQKKKKLLKRSYPKTQIPSKIKNLLHEFDEENNQEELDEIHLLQRKGDNISSGIYNGQSIVNPGPGVRKKKQVQFQTVVSEVVNEES